MKERLITIGLLMTALSSILGLLIITAFVFKEGVPFILRHRVTDFFFSTGWWPTEKHPEFGILSMIVGSVSVSLGALVIGVPFGLGCAVLLSEFAPRPVTVTLKPALELLAGIPSVVYGFLGMTILVPMLRTAFGGTGFSVLAGVTVLSVMILPTIISISMDSIAAVPRSYREGSIALGATQWQTTYMVVLRAARSGIVAAVVLGMGRAIGETMALIMVAGNAKALPTSLLAPFRALTTTIGIEMGYASGDHQRALFAVGVVLFVMIMILNSVAVAASRSRVPR